MLIIYAIGLGIYLEYGFLYTAIAVFLMCLLFAYVTRRKNRLNAGVLSYLSSLLINSIKMAVISIVIVMIIGIILRILYRLI
jgi:hypothetical protein